MNTVVKIFGRVEKRLRFVTSALILTFIMFVSTFFFFDKAFFFLPLFIVLTYFLTFFSLLEGVEKVEWFTLFIVPVFLTISFYLFYFLFPVRWLTRVPFLMIYGISVYAVILASNIFNVGVEKSLQLQRAAFSVNYFYQTLILFLFLNVIYSLKLNFMLTGLAVSVVIFPLTFQLLWTVKLNLSVEKMIVSYAVFASLIIGQIAMGLSFMPLRSTIFALLLTSCFYSLVGLLYHYIDQKLFQNVIREYALVVVFVLAITFLSLNW